jgi:amino acid transporter
MFIALLFASKEDFARNFSSLTGTPMAEVAKTAAEGGFVTADFDLWATVKAIIWPVITMWAFFFSISFGGEIKAAKKGQFFGIVGSCVAFGVVACIASAILNSKIGIGEQGALVWNSLIGSGPSTPTSPNAPTLAMIAINSPVIAVLTGVGFLLWVFFWLTNIPSYCGRAFFAHSIDRLAPAAVGHVTPKRRIPLGSLLTAYGVALIFFALFVFTDFFAALAIGMPLFFAFIGSLITGAILFKTRPNLWQRSPAAAYRVGKLPVMSIVCGIGIAVLVFIEVLVYEDPSSLAKTRNSWIAIGAIVALAVLGYLAVSRIRRRQGVELSQLTREIPVE